MKTKSNVQKAATKLLTLGLLIVFGLSVNAHGIKKPVSEANRSNELATKKYGLGEESSLTSDLDNIAFYLGLDAEPMLEVEDWMTDESIFDVYAVYLQIDPEEALEVEDWMKDESTFFLLHSDFNTIPDPDLELEEWMTSDEVWRP